MDRNSVDWRGNFNAIVTPFQKSGALDEKAFVENIRLLMAEGIDGVVVTGCTGEFWAMTFEERLRCYELAVEAAGGRIKVIAGTADVLASRVIELSLAAKERGVDGLMVTPPYYALPNWRETKEHFRRISDAVQHPILLYNIPKRQGIHVSPAQIAELAAEVECIAAVKQSTASFVEVLDTIRLAGSTIRVLAGHSVDRGAPCVLMGADGYVSSVEPQVMGADAIRLFRLAAEGRVEEARDVQFRCITLDHAIHGGVGTFPASLKAAMNLLGRPGGYPREPLLELTPDENRRLRAVLGEIGLLG